MYTNTHIHINRYNTILGEIEKLNRLLRCASRKQLYTILDQMEKLNRLVRFSSRKQPRV